MYGVMPFRTARESAMLPTELAIGNDPYANSFLVARINDSNPSAR